MQVIVHKVNKLEYECFPNYEVKLQLRIDSISMSFLICSHSWLNWCCERPWYASTSILKVWELKNYHYRLDPAQDKNKLLWISFFGCNIRLVQSRRRQYCHGILWEVSIEENLKELSLAETENNHAILPLIEDNGSNHSIQFFNK